MSFGRETRNWIAKYPERLRTRVFTSLEGFRMYTHYGCVGAISIIRVGRLSDNTLPSKVENVHVHINEY